MGQATLREIGDAIEAQCETCCPLISPDSCTAYISCFGCRRVVLVRRVGETPGSIEQQLAYWEKVLLPLVTSWSLGLDAAGLGCGPLSGPLGWLNRWVEGHCLVRSAEVLVIELGGRDWLLGLCERFFSGHELTKKPVGSADRFFHLRLSCVGNPGQARDRSSSGCCNGNGRVSGELSCALEARKICPMSGHCRRGWSADLCKLAHHPRECWKGQKQLVAERGRVRTRSQACLLVETPSSGPPPA
jgi:hypothetical protein